jgi:N-formylglutamate amidohydrolase
MPHEALENVGPPGTLRPHIVLGDRFGAAAAGSVVEKVEAAFSRAGFRVARNMPFAGAYITQHYGRPTRRQHAVQVEIDRSLYMDEKTLQPHAGYDDFVVALNGAIADIAAIGWSDRRLAAE